MILSNRQKLPHPLKRLLPKPQVREGGVWQPSNRPQVARRECRNSRRRKISRASRFKSRALAVAFVESPILLKLGRRLLASTNSPRPLCLGEEFSEAQRALQSYQRNYCRRGASTIAQ